MGRINRLVLLLGLAFKDAQSRQIVLDLLKRCQGRLAIVSNSRVVLCTRRFSLRMAASAIEEGLINGEAYGPKPARPVEPGIECAALESGDPVEG